MPIAFTVSKTAMATGLALLLAACAGPYYGPGPHRGASVHAPPQTHCPPGLAKKGDCTPPGHRKHWERGDVLPDHIRFRVVNNYREYGFRPPPRDHVYIAIDGGIYLLARPSRRIVEIYGAGR